MDYPSTEFEIKNHTLLFDEWREENCSRGVDPEIITFRLLRDCDEERHSQGISTVCG
jgi:hypothetical protein